MDNIENITIRDLRATLHTERTRAGRIRAIIRRIADVIREIGPISTTDTSGNSIKLRYGDHKDRLSVKTSGDTMTGAIWVEAETRSLSQELRNIRRIFRAIAELNAAFSAQVDQSREEEKNAIRFLGGR